ncbi:MAG: DUF3489 domain-containing protein [Alphaproteobacteria bacterium]
MAKKLTDSQLVILSNSAQRDDGLILPLPDGLTLVGGARTKCLQTLIDRGYIEEIGGAPDWQDRDGDDPKALRITAAGLEALGIATPAPATEKAPPEPKAPKKGGKTDAILKLMRRKQGATVPALQDATGWQPHSVRAALTGLRKKGIDIARDKNGKGETIYRAGA